MKTEIFESYGAFLEREDKTINGVDQEFADQNPDFEKQNETNKGCWNCTHCTDCTDCYKCTYCYNCAGCWKCTHCTDCTDCYNCTFCYNCADCTRCTGCTDCWNCSNCKGRTGFYRYTGETDSKTNHHEETSGDVLMSRDPKSTYYDAGGIETLDVIKAKLTPEQYRGYLLGNAIKYACRFNFKGSSERDAEKLAVYSSELAAIACKQGGGA